MFNLFKIKKFKKNADINIFVCKHCKLSCRNCTNIYCYSCFSNTNNPCPRCGKKNSEAVEK